MIYIVRHGHAGDKRKWHGPDHIRPLSDTGRRESHGLLTRLGGSAISSIRSSPTMRCVQTVGELAAQRGLPIRIDTRLAPDADLDDLLALIFVDDDVVLCTHGEIIADLFDALRDRRAPITAFAEWPKGSIWRLAVANGAISSATYLPPLATAFTEPDLPRLPIPSQRSSAALGHASP
jgi:broad specificity phosphatase PhoE